MVEELGRVASREVISMDGWRELDDPEEQIASVMNEVRMVRRGCEIWPHQRYFVDLAYRRHISPWGCRVVLADTVGLGKTIQTGMVLKLAALSGDKPILVLLPPSLMIQWQEELSEMLGVPSARLSRNYSGSLWITNDGRKTPNRKEPVLLNCPTRIGLVSTGLVNNGSDEILDQILSMEYDCVVVDEAHHARWHLPGMGVSGRKYETIHKNKLYTFLEKLAPRTHSLLLATATPVQLELMELHDLLRLLSLTQTGENIVLGNDRSFWNQNAKSAMETILRPENYDSGSGTISNWEVFRNPISPFPEDGFLAIRQHLGMKESAASGQAEDFERLLRGDRDKIHSLFCGEQPEFLRKHNPVIRSVVRRERVNLEQQINEKTGKPYLRKIDVVETSGRLNLSTPMMDAYHCAQRFCSMLQGTGKGLRETLLLRRIGSSIQAGKITAQNFLDNGKIVTDLDEENDFADERDYDTPAENSQEKNGKNPLILTSYQITLLQNLLRHLDNAGDDDPKQQKVFDLLEKEKWLESGCVIFSQYYDTADWIADVLVERFPDEVIGLYAGGGRARVWQNESWHEETRDNIKKRVLSGEIRLLVSTDAGAEGLNLQALANLINLDLPWNPTKLIQRLGRLCRPGQRRDYVNVCNLMYIDSVEAKVFNILSQRFQTITELFGVLPDCLSSIWRDMAKDDVTGEASVRQEADRLSRIIEDNPFQEKYNATVKPMEWERIRKVLHAKDMEKVLRKGWKTP
jgi:SNF2 family DNA or RNA helicase